MNAWHLLTLHFGTGFGGRRTETNLELLHSQLGYEWNKDMLFVQRQIWLRPSSSKPKHQLLKSSYLSRHIALLCLLSSKMLDYQLNSIQISTEGKGMEVEK